MGAVVPDVASLTAMFFLLNFLAATQDVAVDGWALTMLAPSNVGTAPLLHQNCLLTCLVCRLCGHLQLRGPDHRLGPRLRPLHHHGEQRIDVCPVQFNRISCCVQGLVNLSQFLIFWAIVFLITTTLIAFFKKEKAGLDGSEAVEAGAEQELGLIQTYKYGDSLVNSFFVTSVMSSVVWEA